MAYILLDFMGRVSDENLSGFASSVSLHMTGNSEFPDLVVLVNAVTADLKAFNDAVSTAKTGGTRDRLLARQAKATLQSSLKAAAKACNYQTSDRATLLTTGYNVNKETRDRKVLQPITDLAAAPAAEAGSIFLRFSRPDGMQSAMAAWRDTAGANVWNIETGRNACSTTLTGLPMGVPIEIMVTATGSRGQQVVSNIITCYASFDNNYRRR